MERRRHDRAILDALEMMPTESFQGDVWRVTGRGRDPLRGSTADGRWSPSGEFEVLYTSMEKLGAVAEIGYRLSLEPVWPSLMQHEVHRIEANISRTVRFQGILALSHLGVDVTRYTSFDYSITQAIAAAANFLELDGIIVPSARSPASHLVIMIEHVHAESALVLKESELVDWEQWKKNR